MEDFRRFEVIADIARDHQAEIDRIRREVNLKPGQRINLRRIVVSFTVVVLGMLAWWGQ